MKRRGFLGLLAGAAVAPFVPTPEPPLVPVTLTAEAAVDCFGYESFEPYSSIGDTVTVRIPQRYLVNRSLAYQPQDMR